MPPKSSRTCKAEIRNQTTGIREICEIEYSSEECPNRKVTHIHPLKSGYCNSHWCEGTKARSFRGTPCPTCKFWLTCPCDCHDMMSMIFQQSEMPRLLVENPEYKPIHITGLLSSEDRARVHAERRKEEREIRFTESIATDGGTEIFSPSGRTRKGLLDGWVEIQCKLWALNPDVDCTPMWISESIAIFYDVPSPSVGAIDAVLKRWTECGFAIVEKKPTRFVSFTPDGERLGLETMREKAKLASKKWSAPSLVRASR